MLTLAVEDSKILQAHLETLANLQNGFQMATTVVVYLQKTDFFEWYLKQPNCPKNNLHELTKYVGGLITKHIAQLACNSNTIEHWASTSLESLFPDVQITVATGIYPSVSIMNHSCKPNVANYFVDDTIIVKALEDIAENEEIFNCYGIDYKSMVRDKRQFACKKLYHFECQCVICSDLTKEINMLDCYLCPKCKGPISENVETYSSACRKCNEKYHLKPFRKINEEARKCLQGTGGDTTNTLELLVKCLKIREKILYKHHKDFEEVYMKFYTYYESNGDASNMYKYFKLSVENESYRCGRNSRYIAIKLYAGALAILHCLQHSHLKNSVDLVPFLEQIEEMIKESKIIANLYYPAHITNRLSRKIQCLSAK